MGIQDRDYTREKRLRWDTKRGEFRMPDEDGGDEEGGEEPPKKGPPAWLWFTLAAVLLVLAWRQHLQDDEAPRPLHRGPLPQEVRDRVAMRQQGEAVPMLPGSLIRVIDGDTIEVKLDSGPIEVRLHGVDAPEYDQPGGMDAKKALAKHLKAQGQVSLEPIEQDSYLRLVADVYAGDEFVNEWLLRQGYAWAYRHYASDSRFCGWEGEARASKRGLWSLPLADWRVAPWDWRKHQRVPQFQPKDYSAVTVESCIEELQHERAAPAPLPIVSPTPGAAPTSPSPDAPPGTQAGPSGCVIKGNINSRGDKVYQTPDMPAYDKTKVNPAKGERWFCTVDEARKAGWRPPRR
jgi:endonuclease YncB( thermonuclease family)